MAFKKELYRNYYLCDTPVENIFIDEYMADAPGEYVKVYIYAYMYSQLNQVMNNEILAKRLNMNIEDVLTAWTYWEGIGIIRKYYPNPEDETHYDVEFINIKSTLFSNSDGKSSEKKSNSVKSTLGDEGLASLYKEVESITGKLFDPTLALKVADLIDDTGVDPSIVAFAYRYCKENNKPTDFKYVASIVKRWAQNNLSTVKDVKDFIESYDNRFDEHRQIMKALGLSPSGITESERDTFNSWLDEMGFSLSFILEVCSRAAGMSYKFSYVRKVLESEYEKQNPEKAKAPKKPNLNDRQKFYEKMRFKGEKETARRRDEVYTKVPKIAQIENELRTLGMEVGKMMLSDKENREEAVNMTKRRIRAKQDEKLRLLQEAGFSTDYMNDVYNCYKCKDTGILDNGSHCSCYKISTEKI